MSNPYAERALYILQCAEKERDELQYRIDHAAPNDAIRINGASMLNGFKDKIAQARQNAVAAGASLPQQSIAANVNAKETDRILHLPKQAKR